MRTPIAHSARKNYPPQTYEAHVRGVCERAGKYAAEAECYSVKANGILSAIVRDSALLHDLGKLEDGTRAFCVSRAEGGGICLWTIPTPEAPPCRRWGAAVPQCWYTPITRVSPICRRNLQQEDAPYSEMGMPRCAQRRMLRCLHCFGSMKRFFPGSQTKKCRRMTGTRRCSSVWRFPVLRMPTTATRPRHSGRLKKPCGAAPAGTARCAGPLCV